MIQSYNIEQAAERLGLDAAELRFLTHHLWEFFSQSNPEGPARSYAGTDLALLERVIAWQKDEMLDVSTIRQKLRMETGAFQIAGKRHSDLLAFCGGRPGVGASTMVWNLAAALAQRGARCTIVNGAFTRGAAPAVATEYFADPTAQWCQILDSGVRLVDASYLVAMMESDTGELSEETARELRLLDNASDFVLIDTGEGCSDNALRFGMLVDETIMVTTADVGVNADCFSVVRMLRDVDPDLPMGLVVNRAASLGEAREAFARINGAGSKLGFSDVTGLGWVIEDDDVRRCMAKGEAIVNALPNSPAARCIGLLADMLANRLTPARRHAQGGLLELVRGLGSNRQKAVVARVL